MLPKHNFMVHYPRCISKINHIWTMRFKAKHKFSKDSVKNFKNVTVLLANKHQFAVAYHWECLSLKAVESGPVKICSLETLEFSENASASLYVDSQTTVNLTKWVRCCGVKYRVGLFHRYWWKHATIQQNNLILHNGKVFFCFDWAWNMYPWFSHEWQHTKEHNGYRKGKIKTFQIFSCPNVIRVWFTILCCVKELCYLISYWN